MKPKNRRPALRTIEFDITPSSLGSKITVNGVELPYVRKVEIVAEARHASKIFIEMFALEGVTVKGKSFVETKFVDPKT